MKGGSKRGVEPQAGKVRKGIIPTDETVPAGLKEGGGGEFIRTR